MESTPKSLDELLEAASNWWKFATPEEKDEIIHKQRESWVRAEMNWPKSKYKWINGVKVYDSYEDYIND